MSNRKALSLFLGGKDGVIEKMRSSIIEALSNKETKTVFEKWLADEVGSKGDENNPLKDEFDRLKNCDREIVFQFFEKVKEVLGLSISEVLGNPSFADGDREYWSKQRKMMPMVLTAPVKESANTKSGGRKNVDDEKELRFYVRRRAIHELAWNE